MQIFNTRFSLPFFIWISFTNIASAETLTEAPSNKTLSLDLAIVGLGGLGYWGAHFIPMNIDTQRSTPQGIDGWIDPQWNPQWKGTSDFLGTPYANYGFNLPVLTTVSMATWGIQTQNSWSTAVPVAQAVAITGVVTELTKRLVARPRPYTSAAFEAKYPEVYDSEEMKVLRANNDTFKSFPSGHTSNAATTYFTSAVMIAAHYEDPTIDALAYGTASVLTVLTGYSRVRYGKHHITDTVVGAVIGTGIGWGVAHWHLRRD